MRHALLLQLLMVLLVGCQQHLPTADRQPPALSVAAAPTTQSAASVVTRPAAQPTSVSRETPAPRITAGASGQSTTVERLDEATRTPEPDRPTFQTYTIKPGDTLSGIAAKLGVTMNDLVQANGLSDPNRIQIGQELRVPTRVEVSAPGDKLLPDSEVVYGVTSTGFDVARFAQSQPGYLKAYTENVEGRELSGPEIIQLVAQRFSVAPRLLLTIIELKGEWLSNPAPGEPAKTYPAGRVDGARTKLFRQASWAANQLNEGYYGWKSRQQATLTFKDGSKAKLNGALNAGTLGVQFMLAQVTAPDQFAALVAKDGDFAKLYQRLFGDPFSRGQDVVIPTGVRQPDMKLPWPSGERWFYSGGPHGGWGSGSAWAALDFIPGTVNMGGCWDASAFWVLAAAPGLVIRSDNGEVMIDLDGDGQETTGWNVLYMHIASRDRVALGTRVKAGDRIGHPSCEGGFSTGTHLHMARKYNGEWVAADGPIPFALSGWVARGKAEYDGFMVRGGESKESCECRDEATNGLLSDNR